MPTCRVNDATVHYHDRGAGPVVVLLHAFPLSAEMWRPQLDALSDSYRVLAPDFPGFGGSTAAAGMTIESMADGVAGFLDAAGVTGPVVLGGLSMGGYVAFAFARKYPDRLRGLILADTKPEPDDAVAKANRDAQLAGLASGELTPAKLVEQSRPKMLAPTADAAVVAEMTRIGSAQPAESIAAAVRALRDRPDSTPSLGNIRVPTLVLVGEHDAITPPAGATATAGRIDGAKLVVIAGAGHVANLENSGAFTTAVREFLAST